MSLRGQDRQAIRWAGAAILAAAVLALPAAAGADAVVLEGVPSYEWFYGCSPTSAGMLVGYYDRNGYEGSMYGALVPGGLAESNTFAAEYDEDWSALAHSAIASEEHVDDFWGKPDPLESGRTSTAEWNCLADYMGTSQGDMNDGYTPWHDYSATPHQWEDCDWGYGLHGIVKYIQYCGYEVTTAYRQGVDARVTGGFSYDDYKAEIDARRPVLIHVTGHTMCGIGYDDEEEKVYLYDTWDEVTGVMAWGGSYDGRTHNAVTALTITGGSELPDMPAPPDWWGANDGRTIALAYCLTYAHWGDCAAAAYESPPPDSPTMPCYSGSALQATSGVVHSELEGGSWGVAGTGQSGQIVVEIDNCEDPEETKYVFAQFYLRTEGDGYFAVSLETLGGELITGGDVILLDTDGVWDIYGVQWEITPQPPAERIVFDLLSGSAGEVWVQNVAVGTHCTPEPACAALLVLGAWALRRRRPAGRP